MVSSPDINQHNHLSGEFTSSATDWMGATTNSEEDCSYSSDIDNISDSNIEKEKHFLAYDNDLAPTAIFSKPTLKGNLTKICYHFVILYQSMTASFTLSNDIA